MPAPLFEEGDHLALREVLDELWDRVEEVRPWASRPARTAVGLVFPPWTNFGAGWPGLAYRRLPGKAVWVSGLIQSNGAYGAPLNIGVVPIPAEGNHKLRNYSAGGICNIDVNATGMISLQAGGAVPGGAGWWLWIEGLYWAA